MYTCTQCHPMNISHYCQCLNGYVAYSNYRKYLIIAERKAKNKQTTPKTKQIQTLKTNHLFLSRNTNGAKMHNNSSPLISFIFHHILRLWRPPEKQPWRSSGYLHPKIQNIPMKQLEKKLPSNGSSEVWQFETILLSNKSIRLVF